jgi:hypothetical protein
MGNAAVECTVGVSAENADFPSSFFPSVSRYSTYPLNHSAASSSMTITAFCQHGACVCFTECRNKQGQRAIP